MKKITAILLAFAMTATLNVSALAADFTGSVEAKPAPQVVEQTAPDGGNYCVLILDPEDDLEKALIFTIDGEPFIITDYVPLFSKDSGSDLLEFCITALTEEALLPEIREKLDSAKEQLQNVENLGELDEGIDVAIEERITAFFGDSQNRIASTDLVISDVFNAEFVYNKDTIVQVQADQKIQFMFKPNFTKDDFFILLHNPEGTTWEVVTDYEWTEEGYLIVRVDQLSVFAIAVEKPVDLSVAPDAPEAP